MDPTGPRFGAVSGFILAGGQSRRMGRDKARLPWNDKTLIETVAERIADVTGSAPSVVGGEPVDGLPYVADPNAGFGPVAGIAAALAACPTEWALVVACDMPALDGAFLTGLIDAADNDGVVPVSEADGRIHPMCAVWSSRTRSVFDAAIRDGEHMLRNVVERLNITFLNVKDTAALRNVNTPEEYAIALAGTRE